MSLLLTLALVTSAALPHAPSAQDEDAGAPPTEVLVVGTLHAPWLFRSARYTPAHLRAVLAAFEPDVVALQCPAEWLAAGRFLPGMYEGPAIVMPYSRAQGVPVHGVDALDLERWEVADDARIRRHASMLTRSLGAGAIPPTLYGQVPVDRLDDTRVYFERPEYDFRLMNEGDGGSAGAARREGLRNGPDQGGGRNQRMAASCLDIIAEHPGAKLLVLVGSGHKAVLDALLGGEPGVRVLALGEDVEAPTREEVEAAWTPEDLAATLGHNLDGERSYFHAELNDLSRMGALAQHLEREPGYGAIAAYFLARIAFHRGEYEGALERLDGIEVPEDGPALYPYPMGQWRMRYRFDQAVELERARTLVALGRPDEARELLVALYEAMPVPPAFEAQAPAEGAAVGSIGDAGFEAVEFPARMVPGRWWSEEVAAGRQEAARDASEKAQGEASLRLEVLEPRGVGRASLSQEVFVDEAMRAAGELRFDVHCRAEGLRDLMLAALVRSGEGGDFVHLGRAGARLEEGVWSQATLRFRCPEDAAVIELHLTYDSTPGARLWLDDARLTDDSAPPFKDWGAAILAREFPRTVLEGL